MTEDAGPDVTSARILVVDDNSVMRMKMKKAVLALGHDAGVAKDGAAALDALAQTPFDAVLLDIVMPGMDGFEVLSRLKNDPKLSHIPVIVVSALDDELSSVVKAIELGAEDFLPKDFEPVLLRARLEASLTKKRFRDQELEYFDRIDQLTKAAERLEMGNFNPESLALDALVEKRDPLGRLALVFRGMAAEIYQRELRLKQTIQTMRGSIWVIVIGTIWGLVPSMSRIVMAEEGTTSLGMTFWLNPATALIVLTIAVFRRGLPRLTWRNIRFAIVWAVVSAVLMRVVMYTVSGHVEAAILSLVLTLQGFLVFAFSAILGADKATARRLFGLVVGLGGVALLMWTQIGGGGGTPVFWLFVACMVPLLLAIEVMIMAGFRPEGLDDFGALGFMMVAASAICIPWTLAEGEFFPLDFLSPGRLELAMLGLVIAAVSTYTMAFHLIKTAGAVFYSQTAYTMTIAGVIWGVLLLSESLSPLAWLSFAVIVVGMYLVEPKSDGKEIKIQRDFQA